MSLLGSVTYKAESSCSARLLRFISENSLSVQNMYEKNGWLYFTVGYELKRDIDARLNAISAEYEIIRETGLIRVAKCCLRKKGVLIGCAVSFLTILLLSDTVFSFEVLTDNSKLKADVLAVLYQNGVTAGSSIKDVDFTLIERDMKKKLDSISWAGISVQGCKVTVDLVENVDKPEFTQKRLPTNLIAREDAVIDKIDYIDGQLMTTVGSGVKKGDVIISGDVLGDLNYTRHGFVKHFYVHYYTRSLGKVYGTFERTETFFQPYSVTEKALAAEPVEKSFLSLFDVDIPLFFTGESSSIITEQQFTPLTFMGAELPVAVKSYELTEYQITERPIDELEAGRRAEQLAETYEHNFLSEYEILSKDFTSKITPEGVYLTAKYKLHGVISEEVEFFINK